MLNRAALSEPCGSTLPCTNFQYRRRRRILFEVYFRCLPSPSFLRPPIFLPSFCAPSFVSGRIGNRCTLCLGPPSLRLPHVFLFLTGGNFIFALEFHSYVCVWGHSTLYPPPMSARRRRMRLWKIDSISYGKLFVCVRITLSAPSHSPLSPPTSCPHLSLPFRLGRGLQSLLM